VLDARAALGEGPDWDEERQREGGAVRFAPDGRLDAVVEPPVGLVMSW
jgi:sugar lactone lactonase YvrE